MNSNGTRNAKIPALSTYIMDKTASENKREVTPNQHPYV